MSLILIVIKNGCLIYYNSLHNTFFHFISAIHIITRIIDHLLFDFCFFSICLFGWFLIMFKFALSKNFNL